MNSNQYWYRHYPTATPTSLPTARPSPAPTISPAPTVSPAPTMRWRTAEAPPGWYSWIFGSGTSGASAAQLSSPYFLAGLCAATLLTARNRRRRKWGGFPGDRDRYGAGAGFDAVERQYKTIGDVDVGLPDAHGMYRDAHYGPGGVGDLGVGTDYRGPYDRTREVEGGEYRWQGYSESLASTAVADNRDAYSPLHHRRGGQQRGYRDRSPDRGANEAAYAVHRMGENRPSPFHPDRHAPHVVPDQDFLVSFMGRLRADAGVRLLAHGAKTRHPRRVHVRALRSCITWQTEKVADRTVRGTVHVVNLRDVLYVDIGKRTAALRRPEVAPVPDEVCLSLLTSDGSLDLQAPSRPERDALVSCFCLILDEAHPGWREEAARGGGDPFIA